MNNNKQPKQGNFVKNILMWVILAIVVVVGFNFFFSSNQSSVDKISYSQLMTKLDGNKIENVTMQPSDSLITVTGEYKEPVKVKGTNNFPLLGNSSSEVKNFQAYIIPTDSVVKDIQNAAKSNDVKLSVVQASSSGMWVQILSYIIPMLLFVGIFWLMMGGMGARGGGGGGNPMSFGKSRAKQQDGKTSKVRFADVAGSEEEKQELVEVVDFLKNPKKYHDLGARIPAGVLLEGPPGTGKTLLAKAVAGEAGVPFFSISGSDFVEMFVGVGAARVRDMFAEAKNNAPCIIFIDEIDAVARQRGAGLGGGHDEREQTLNQLLVEMDGFSANSGIIVMAATNRIDILDPAILRPGRFDRKITVGYPDREARLQILKVHSRNKPLADDVDLESLASVSVGFTGADLANIMNEAAIAAAVDHRQYITNEDVKNSFIREGIGVEKKSRVISEKDKLITAYHETGHAILFHELPDVGPVHIISIIPTGMGAAGYTMPLPEKDELFNTKGKMMQNIMVAMGGRIAEEIIFDDVTTGASQDIKQASQLARDMVTKYGFSKDLGFLDYSTQSDELFIGRELAYSNNFSEQTATKIDEAVKEIIDECYAKAKKIILDNKDVLERAAKALIKKEKLSREEFEAIFRGEEIDLSGKAKEEESDNTSEATDNNEHTAESNSTAKDNVTDNDNSADLNDVHDNNSNVDHDESDNNQN